MLVTIRGIRALLQRMRLFKSPASNFAPRGANTGITALADTRRFDYRVPRPCAKLSEQRGEPPLGVPPPYSGDRHCVHKDGSDAVQAGKAMERIVHKWGSDTYL